MKDLILAGILKCVADEPEHDDSEIFGENFSKLIQDMFILVSAGMDQQEMARGLLHSARTVVVRELKDSLVARIKSHAAEAWKYLEMVEVPKPLGFGECHFKCAFRNGNNGRVVPDCQLNKGERSKVGGQGMCGGKTYLFPGKKCVRGEK